MAPAYKNRDRGQRSTNGVVNMCMEVSKAKTKGSKTDTPSKMDSGRVKRMM